MGSDVAGGSDDQLRSGSIDHVGIVRCGASLFEPSNMADTGTVDNLIFAVVGAGLSEQVLGCHPRRYRFVQIDNATPDFGMLERKRASQAPQNRMCGVGAVAFGDRLRVACGDEQPGWESQPRQFRDKPSGRMEQAIPG